MNRREFIQIALAGSSAIAGCETKKNNESTDGQPSAGKTSHAEKVKIVKSEAEQSKDMHAGLKTLQEKGWQFAVRGSDNVKEIASVAEWIGQNPSTISFAYGVCGDGVCPLVVANLARASERVPSLHHVIISVSPESDHSTAELQKLVSAHPELHENTIVLYPLKSLNAGKTLAEMQQQLNLTTIGDDAKMHLPKVTLYTANGQLFKQVNITTGNLPAEVQTMPRMLNFNGKGK